MTPAHFLLFGHYNRWANDRLYQAAAGLPAEALTRSRPAAYFGSLLGTLNHLLVADRIWLRRIEDSGPEHRRLDEQPFATLPALAAARLAEDERLLVLVASFDQPRLLADLVYANTRGEAQRQPLWQVLAHLFNHQTHHRGQAHALLKDAGAEPPALDLIYFLRETS